MTLCEIIMLSALTVNIGAAARDRAEAILRWLAARPEDVFVLTETSAGPGTSYLLDQFRKSGHVVVHTPDADGDRGAALISRVAFAEAPAAHLMEVSLPGRVAMATLATEPQVTILGVYVPSRDRSLGKTEKKERFLSSLLTALEKLPAEARAATVVGGDYNVISRHHKPLHPGFLPFEFGFLDQLAAQGFTDAYEHCAPGKQAYSWIGRTGDGYRYDYFHVGSALRERMRHCSYVHQTRDQSLTDHAAVTLTLAVDGGGRLATTDPAADDSPALF
jgi:exodeoxyribonuclease-3